MPHQLAGEHFCRERNITFSLTPAGEQWCAALGLPPTAGRARLAYRCMDWSERQDHLAGALAKALLDHYLRQGWLQTDKESRALRVTPKGDRHLAETWGTSPS